jgi:hypothetical protein
LCIEKIKKSKYNPHNKKYAILSFHGLAGGIVQDRMGGSFGAGFLAGSNTSGKNKG